MVTELFLHIGTAHCIQKLTTAAADQLTIAATKFAEDIALAAKAEPALAGNGLLKSDANDLWARVERFVHKFGNQKQKAPNSALPFDHPNAVIKSIDLSGHSGIIKKFDIINKMSKHTFSTEHVENKILSLGSSEIDILDKLAAIILRVDKSGKLQNYSNQIFTRINDMPVTVRVFIENNEVKMLDAFVGESNRKIGNYIRV